MKLLVCYDGSEVAKKALKKAKNLAKLFGAKIDVANAIERWVPLEFTDVQSARQTLDDEIWRVLGRDNTPYKTHLLIDSCSPGDQLVNYATQEKVDEILIGLRKRSKAGKLFFGSTAQHVILNAPCPVVTIK
jgi:nucleotide-binding universal stress UspA family protein